jgi:hypothetical protein
MERTDYTKVFDVSRPSTGAPDPTSKPVIVGHHPVMADPMVRQVPVHHDADTGFDATPHHSKVLQVSDEARAQIAHARPPSPEELAAQAAAEEHRPAVISNPSASPLQAQDTLAQPIPAMPMPAAPTADMPQPAPTLPVQQAAPPPPAQDLSHIQQVPVSHMPASPSGRLKTAGVWLLVAAILIGFGLYLAIDAGFINTGINLPFHIFSREG